jgi:hypothetical protein
MALAFAAHSLVCSELDPRILQVALGIADLAFNAAREYPTSYPPFCHFPIQNPTYPSLTPSLTPFPSYNLEPCTPVQQERFAHYVGQTLRRV